LNFRVTQVEVRCDIYKLNALLYGLSQKPRDILEAEPFVDADDLLARGSTD